MEVYGIETLQDVMKVPVLLGAKGRLLITPRPPFPIPSLSLSTCIPTEKSVFGSYSVNSNSCATTAYALCRKTLKDLAIFRRNYRTTGFESKENGFVSSATVVHFFDVSFTKQ